MEINLKTSLLFKATNVSLNLVSPSLGLSFLVSKCLFFLFLLSSDAPLRSIKQQQKYFSISLSQILHLSIMYVHVYLFLSLSIIFVLLTIGSELNKPMRCL